MIVLTVIQLCKQVHSKAKFGIGYNHTSPPEDYAPIDNNVDENVSEPLSPTFLPNEIPAIKSTPPRVCQSRQFPKFVYPTNTSLEKPEETHLENVHKNNSSDQTEIAPATSYTLSSEGTTQQETSVDPKANLNKGKRPMVEIKFTPSHPHPPYPIMKANKPFIPNYSSLSPAFLKCFKYNHSTEKHGTKTPLEK
ncbi:hypothetical protein E3N88_12145 [Mikania micrantha]|uniref:Uncharacterized protein n=1 Tax=Mikania micrantha TaxID=192012 RepID=A0A5N6P791_9ASTR|nr:hypothetical protein E3N88_12145 [Mikania micrantha]